MSGEADGPTLGEILGEPETPPLPTSHEVAVGIALDAAARFPPGAVSGLFNPILNDPEHVVRGILAEATGRRLGANSAWLRFVKPSAGTGALFIVSNPTPTGIVEFAVVAHRGMLNRSILRAVARWAFYAVGATRLVAHLPVARDDLADFARRAGFRQEGIACGHFHGEGDAAVWAMTLRSCRWLPHAPSPIPTRDLGPPHSLKVH